MVASGGRVCCLDARSGQPSWTFDVGQHSQTQAQLLSSPVVFHDGAEPDRGYRVLVGAALVGVTARTPALYCLEDGLGE